MNARPAASISGPAQESLEAATSDLTPEFRVVVVDGRRRGIRLERLVWRLLGEIAERGGQKRSRLIASVLAAAETSAENVASVLRSFVASTLDKERRTLAERSSLSALLTLMQGAPMPAFALSRDKRLHQVNPEFVQLLRVTGGSLNSKIPADVVQLTLDVPTDELFALIEMSPSTVCNYTLQIDQRLRKGRVKVVGVPPAPHILLVGYIIS